MKTIKILFFILLGLWPVSLWAVPQVPVVVRFSKDHITLEIIWPKAVSYKVSQPTKTQSIVTFDRLGLFNIIGNTANKILIVAPSGGGNKLSLKFNHPSVVRDFRKGSQIVLDIYPAREEASPLLSSKKSDVSKQLQPKEKTSPIITPPVTEHAVVLPDNKLVFPWESDVKAALFERAGDYYIFFDQPMPFDLKSSPIKGIEKIEKISDRAVKIKFSPFYFPDIKKHNKTWEIEGVLQTNCPCAEIVMETKRDDKGHYLFIESSDSGPLLSFKDPKLGDPLIILPVGSDQKGVMERMDTPVFNIIPSYLGVVIRSLSDDLEIKPVEKGLEIRYPGGLPLSSEDERHRVLPPFSLTTILNFQEWRMPKFSWKDAHHFFEDKIISVPEDQRNIPRIELARFYLATNFIREGLNLLSIIKQADEDSGKKIDILILEGIGMTLDEQYKEAFEIFSLPLFTEEPEIQLWRAVTELAQGGSKHPLEIFAKYAGFIKQYPLFIKLQFLKIGVIAALDLKNFVNAQDFLDMAADDPLNQHEKNQMDLLKAQLLSRTEDVKRAEEIWTRIAQEVDDQHSTEAEVCLIASHQEQEKITLENAISRLEALRHKWRGGEIEFNIIYKLAQLYRKGENYRKFFDNLKYIRTHFQVFSERLNINQEMKDAFLKIFLEEDNLPFSLITGLGVYEEFKEFIPVGPKGEKMTEKLADRLIDLDLLDQAVSLLMKQLKDPSDSSKKAKIGSRIALVHFLNNQPEESLKILKETAMPDTLKEVAQERRYLEVKSLAKLERYKEALVLINNDDTKGGLKMRSDILLASKQWAEASRLLQDLIDREGITSASLTAPQSQLILDLAVAIFLAKEKNYLRELRQNFKKLMDTTPYKESFDLVTQSDPSSKETNSDTFDERIKKTQQFEALMTAYQARMKG